MRSKDKNFNHVYFQNDNFSIEGSIYYDAHEDTPYLAVIELMPDDCNGGFEIFSQYYDSSEMAKKRLNSKIKTLINTIYAGVNYAV